MCDLEWQKRKKLIFKTKKSRKMGLKVCMFFVATLINLVSCTRKDAEVHNISLTILYIMVIIEVYFLLEFRNWLIGPFINQSENSKFSDIYRLYCNRVKSLLKQNLSLKKNSSLNFVLFIFGSSGWWGSQPLPKKHNKKERKTDK